MSISCISVPCFLCIVAPLATCLAQTPASFKTSTSTSGYTPENVYAIDLNNDGISDLVQDTVQGANGFTVSIANGDGTFKAPVFYSVTGNPSAGETSNPIASGDFNGDGKVDLVVLIPTTNQLALYLGKGDGTFQAAKYVTVALPFGQVFSTSPIVAADYNQDGKLDLVAVTEHDYEYPSVIVLEGDGSGGFSNPHTIFSGGQTTDIYNLVTGDFDGDGKPDVALTAATGCMDGSFCGTTIHALYGNGDFGFDDTTVYSVSTGLFTIGSGDLNGDGKTDLFGLNHAETEQLGVFYGNSDRTFNSFFVNLPNPSFGGYTNIPGELTPELAMADFNGDSRMDLVANDLTFSSSNNPEAKLVFFLAGDSAGEFTQQTVTLPTYVDTSNPIVALESGYLKPDVVINQSNNMYVGNSAPSYITVLENQAAGNSSPGDTWSPCNYPSTGQGFNFCSASDSTASNQVFNVAANSHGQLRKLELWVDGNKIAEQYNTWGHNAFMDFSSNFGAGSHTGTFFAVNIDNTLQRIDFSFMVDAAGSCSAPSSDGVNVCNPVNDSTVASPVQVQAAAKIAGTLDRMEIWVDGVKKYTETSATSFNTSLSLSSGDHEFDIYAVNTAGTKYEKTVYATAK
jgi:hypothetical protein